MQGIRLGQGNNLVGREMRMQCFQDLLASGKERIARKGDSPMRCKRGQARFQQLTGFLVIEMQVPGQFEDHRLAFGKEISLLPPDDRTTMDSNAPGKLLLREVPASAKLFEQCTKRK